MVKTRASSRVAEETPAERKQVDEPTDLYDLDAGDDDFDGVNRSLLSAVKKATGVDVEKNAIMTEFGDPDLFVPSSASAKISAREILSTMQPIKGKEAKDVASRKLLRKLSRKSSLAVPLETPLANLVARKANYEDVVKILTRKWEHTVRAHKTADQLVFPLPEPIESLKDTSTRSAPTRMNEMENKIHQLLSSSKNHLEDDKVLTPAEEELVKSLSVEEAKARQIELQRMRALLSYQQSKLVRQSKIKSKQYRRILKKEKLKNAEKDFDKMKETDPAGLLEHLESWDKQRALERASLRHKNTGKFAKIAKLRSKYNDAARNALEEQAHLAQKLLQRRQFSDDEESEDEKDQSDEEEADTLNKDGEEAERPSEKPLDDNFNLPSDYNPWLKSIASAALKEKKKERAEASKNQGSKNRGPVLLDLTSFATDEDQIRDDIEEIDDDDEEGEAHASRPKRKQVDKPADESNGEVSKNPKKTKSTSADDQKKLIAEAFAADDVVADFNEEKETQLEKQLDQQLGSSNFLPGWGDWAGVDEDPIQAKKRKRRELREKRKRARLEKKARKEPLFKANVIINSNLKNPITGLKVKTVPYPFLSVKDYEAAVLSKPIGRTFVPESSFRQLSAPKIVTKMGRIIEPMSEQMVPKKPVATVKRKKKGTGKSKNTEEKKESSP